MAGLFGAKISSKCLMHSFPVNTAHHVITLGTRQGKYLDHRFSHRLNELN